MMMPTLRMLESLRGDGAKHFVEPARLEMKLLECKALTRGELAHGRKDRLARARQRREPRFAVAHLHLCHGGQRGKRGANGGELLRAHESNRHGVVVARLCRKSVRGIIGQDPS